MIYLDHAATTEMYYKAIDEMSSFLYVDYGNPNAAYRIGRYARDAIEAARKRVAKLLGCDSRNIIFTSGGSEGNTTAVRTLHSMCETDDSRKSILISDVEHDSVYNAASEYFQSVYYAGVKESGSVTTDEVLNYVNRKCYNGPVGAASIMCVNNETGAVNDIKHIGTILRNNGIAFHSDCVQALGVVPMADVIPYCDYASFSAHKIHGPKGVGCIYARNPESIDRLIYGGRTQEGGLRGGTENVAGIVGFGAAASILNEVWLEHLNLATQVKDAFYKCLCGQLSENLRVNGLSSDSNGKILNVTIPRVDAATLVLALDTEGVCASAGSACHAHTSSPSRVLTMMGIEDDDAMCSVRFSFDASITIPMAEKAACIVAKTVRILRGEC